MSTLDSRIDDLYRQPLAEFIAARQALAKSVSGEERKRVAALRKPLAVPWAVNQTYWNARRVYDRLLSAGEKLRAAQVGALKGRTTDIRSATAQHSEALNDAVAEAARVSEGAGLSPQPDALRRMFEAISTRTSLPAPHGRFVEALEPASGFEALAGIPIAAPRPAAKAETTSKSEAAVQRPTPKLPRSDFRAQERDRLEAGRRRRAAIKRAEEKAKRTAAALARAKTQWERAKRELEEADRALADLLADET